MARNLFLYSVGYNRSEQTHFIFNSKITYLDKLAPHLLFSVPFNTWRINGGRLLISREAFANAQADYKGVAYVADVPYDNQQEAVFYHVRRVYDESNFVVLDIEMDNWATYWPKATISQLHVTRCNRAIAEGLFDSVKETKGYLFNYYGIGALNRPISDFCVVFLASVVIKTGFFGDDPLTQNVMLLLPLSDLSAAANSAWASLDIVEKVRFVMGGIYKTAAFGVSTNIGVLRCWILPNEAVSASKFGLASITTNTMVTGNADYTFKNVFMVRNGEELLSFHFKDFLGGEAAALYPNSELQFGAIGHAMPLRRFIGDDRVYARFFAESGEIRAQVEQGNNIMDISSAFELDINVNNQTGTGIQQLSKNLSRFVGIAKGSAKGYAEGGLAGVGLSLASTSAANYSQAIPRAPASNNGDAGTSYSLNDPDYVTYPLVLAATDSINDERENAYFRGASFDVYNSDFAGIQQSAHLGAVAAGRERTGTFLQADGFNVSGLNTEAERFIRDEFKRGIWFEVI